MLYEYGDFMAFRMLFCGECNFYSFFLYPTNYGVRSEVVNHLAIIKGTGKNCIPVVCLDLILALYLLGILLIIFDRILFFVINW